jgi:glyoxylase-like metal-dependent hydrolase (beta-lactamase superfamily II)
MRNPGLSTPLLGIVVLAIALMQPARAAPYADVTVAFDLRQVPDSSVYYVVGQSGIPGPENQGFTSNAGFVVTSRGVVVYDALGTPPLGYRLLQAIRSVTDKPLKTVVVGHYHADHFYGLQAFKQHTDAEIWAEEAARIYLNSPGAKERLQQRREALFPWVDESTYVVEPDKTYQGTTQIPMGDTNIELIPVGPAHAPGDTLMVVKEPGVIFSGDILFDGRLPFVGDGIDSKNWIEQLERLRNMEPKPRFVVPGHGEPSANAEQAIAFTQGYLQYLRERMGQAAEDLVPFEEAYEATDWSRYEGLPAFAATNRRNAYQVYLEMQAASF